MELLAVIGTLCILSLLVTPCSAHQTHVFSSLDQVYHDLGISLTNLPRKLRPVEEPIVRRCKTDDSKSEANNKQDFSDKIHSPVMLPGKEGTRQRWIEGKDMWQFFTMDYSQVRRRQPVHNKAVPTRP
ncbi:hypothetical protein NE237_019574 [Protea cynaroides]|uniref:Uncharacterized protein n=1 Tax=Protea cynaroides TaxID=273540 RepID=A0A9Q0H9M4_9MAGN|nr:hypothetical protein NE237_019574 [Protea cynaroides]